jgi:hypothetical protein
VSSIQTQNRDLNADNQRIIPSLVHSGHTLDFMQGLVNSLRNEILGLASVSMLQFKYLENLRSNTGDAAAIYNTRTCQSPLSVRSCRIQH